MEINMEKGNVMLNRTGFSSTALTRKTAKSFFIAPAVILICFNIFLPSQQFIVSGD
jgi:hypothetical protein